MENGVSVRLIGVNAPERGQNEYREATERLRDLVENKKVFLEYDRYQEDKYGRILAWVWTGCESEPKFLPANYMHKSDRESNPGLTENPKGCKKGKLVQEEMVRGGFAKVEIYEDRGELKYEKRLLTRE